MMVNTLIKQLAALMIMFLYPGQIWAQEPKTDLVVQKGATVSIRYTIFDEENVVIETNKDSDPVRYVQGRGRMIPGVDRALDGMHVGDKKCLKLEPKDAYGEVDPRARFEVPKAKIPPELLTAGGKLLGHAGRQIVPARILEIRQDTVVVDANHPLAGKTVTVEIEVIEITLPAQKPQPPES